MSDFHYYEKEAAELSSRLVVLVVVDFHYEKEAVVPSSLVVDFCYEKELVELAGHVLSFWSRCRTSITKRKKKKKKKKEKKLPPNALEFSPKSVIAVKVATDVVDKRRNGLSCITDLHS